MELLKHAHSPVRAITMLLSNSNSYTWFVAQRRKIASTQPNARN